MVKRILSDYVDEEEDEAYEEEDYEEDE